VLEIRPLIQQLCYRSSFLQIYWYDKAMESGITSSKSKKEMRTAKRVRGNSGYTIALITSSQHIPTAQFDEVSAQPFPFHSRPGDAAAVMALSPMSEDP
jgi:hypothetical protein